MTKEIELERFGETLELTALLERYTRLQVLVVELLKKNEDLRQRLVARLDS